MSLLLLFGGEGTAPPSTPEFGWYAPSPPAKGKGPFLAAFVSGLAWTPQVVDMSPPFGWAAQWQQAKAPALKPVPAFTAFVRGPDRAPWGWYVQFDRPAKAATKPIPDGFAWAPQPFVDPPFGWSQPFAQPRQAKARTATDWQVWTPRVPDAVDTAPAFGWATAWQQPQRAKAPVVPQDWRAPFFSEVAAEVRDVSWLVPFPVPRLKKPAQIVWNAWQPFELPGEPECLHLAPTVSPSGGLAAGLGQVASMSARITGGATLGNSFGQRGRMTTTAAGGGKLGPEVENC